MPTPQKPHKYSAEKTNGFSSKIENAVFNWLSLLQLSKKISDLKTQVSVSITEAKIRLVVDFTFIENGKTIYLEVKGMETPVYRLKRRLWKHYGPGELRVIKGNYKKFYVAEVISRD